MYRVRPLDNGKYGNVVGGYRYCLFGFIAWDVMTSLIEFGCEIEVEKLENIAFGIFA